MERHLAGVKVLVAEDEPSLRAVVAESVRNLGGHVVEAGDGDEAWRLCQQHRPDVVVLDVMMPGMSGWEVCKHVKTAGATGRGAVPKVLMLTGIGQSLNEMTSPLFAADDWIDKPFALAELGEKLRRLAARAPARSVPSPPPSGPDLAKAAPREAAPRFGRAHEAVAPEAAAVRVGGAPSAPRVKSDARKRRKRKRKLLKAQARAQAARAARQPKPAAKTKKAKRKAKPVKAPARKPARAKPRKRPGRVR